MGYPQFMSTFHLPRFHAPHTHKQPHNTQQKLDVAHSNVHISANNGRTTMIRLAMERQGEDEQLITWNYDDPSIIRGDMRL